MSMFGSNWLEPGLYVEDGYGSKGKVTDLEEIRESIKNGTLYENDGMCTSKVYDDTDIESRIKE